MHISLYSKLISLYDFREGSDRGGIYGDKLVLADWPPLFCSIRASDWKRSIVGAYEQAFSGALVAEKSDAMGTQLALAGKSSFFSYSKRIRPDTTGRKRF